MWFNETLQEKAPSVNRFEQPALRALANGVINQAVLQMIAGTQVSEESPDSKWQRRG